MKVFFLENSHEKLEHDRMEAFLVQCTPPRKVGQAKCFSILQDPVLALVVLEDETRSYRDELVRNVLNFEHAPLIISKSRIYFWKFAFDFAGDV